jgi:CRP-like cAMP-binding protein
MDASHAVNVNQLLAALPRAQADLFAAQLEPVELRLGDMLYEPGQELQYAYFPTTAIVSVHYVMESGASCEILGVGFEGVVGISMVMGGTSTISSAVVRTAGHAWRLHRRVLVEAFQGAGLVRRLLLRYIQAVIAQTTQTAVCNRHHSIDQSLCRWLLLTLDRLPPGEMRMTQELIANMLGVRREGITVAASKLQNAGYLRYRRGHIAVLDRAGLETLTCECYGVVKAELGRMRVDVLASLEEASTVP